MSPSSISTRRSMQRSRVDLPEPEAPMTATAWCSETVRSTPCRTSFAPQAFVTPLTSKTGRLMSSPPRHATDSPAIDDAGERNRHAQIEESGAHKRRVVEGRGRDDLGLPERLDHTEDRNQGDVLLERDEVVQERRSDSPHRLGQDHVAKRLSLGQADGQGGIALAAVDGPDPGPIDLRNVRAVGERQSDPAEDDGSLGKPDSSSAGMPKPTRYTKMITGTPRNTSTKTADKSRSGNKAAARLVRTRAMTRPTIRTATSIRQNILTSSQKAAATSGNESLKALQEKNVSRTVAQPGLVTASATSPPITTTDETAATA